MFVRTYVCMCLCTYLCMYVYTCNVSRFCTLTKRHLSSAHKRNLWIAISCLNPATPQLVLVSYGAFGAAAAFLWPVSGLSVGPIRFIGCLVLIHSLMISVIITVAGRHFDSQNDKIIRKRLTWQIGLVAFLNFRLFKRRTFQALTMTRPDRYLLRKITYTIDQPTDQAVLRKRFTLTARWTVWGHANGADRFGPCYSLYPHLSTPTMTSSQIIMAE